MEFAKLQGSGNDFIVIDNRDGKVDKLIEKLGISIKDFVVRLCAFHTGIGADGLILIENPENKENHPEVIGTLGYLQECGGKGIVVENKEDLKEALGKDKVGVVAQTTQKEQFFKEVVGELALWVKELKVINTICNATSERQEDVYSLAPKVDVMVIIGGKNSGNTRRLYEIAKSLNPNSYHVETAEELKEEWFKDAQRVGITAGASTPDWIIREVVERIRALDR